MPAARLSPLLALPLLQSLPLLMLSSVTEQLFQFVHDAQ